MIGVNVGDVIATLRLNTTQFDVALAISQQKMQTFSRNLQRTGLYLTVGLTYPLYRLGKAATNSFSAFDDALTRSAAVTKGMTSLMRKEMGDTALTLSKKSILSATDLAKGYFALGQAGYSAAQSIKALPVVEDFAIASSTTLDESIRYLVRTVNGLGIASEDPIKNMEAMTRVSNAYTYAAITTTAEIEDFAVAMTHAAAPALRLVNKSMEEGTSALMALASAGIQAEEAGTLLWTSIRDLQRANIKARSEWERLGLTIYDPVTKNMRNVADIIGDLEVRFSGMSDEGKKVNLMLLGFQDRSLRGIQALMGFSDQMREWQRQMKQAGDLTKQIAEAYLKSFSSQLIMVRNNLNTISISIGRTLAPIIIKMNERIKQFTEWWERLSEATRLVIVEIGIAVITIGPLLILLSKLISTITFLSIGFNIWIASTVKLVAALGLVSLGALAAVAAAGLLIAVAYSVRAAWNKGVGNIKDNLIMFVDIFKLAYEYIGKVATNFANWFPGVWHRMLASAKEEFGNFAKDIGGTWRAIKALVKGEDMGAAFVEGWEEAEATLVQAKTFVADTFDTANAYGRAWLEAFGENVDSLGKAIKEQFGEDVAAVTDLFVRKIKEMNEQFLGLLPSETEQKMIDFINAQQKIKQNVGDTSSEFDVWSMHLREAVKWQDRFAEVAVRGFETTADAITEFATTGSTSIKKLASTILTDLLGAIVRMQMAMALQRWIQPAGANIWGNILGMFGGGGGLKFGGSTDVGSGVMGTGPGGASMFGSTIAAAFGKVFRRGQVIPLAAGGIIGGPSLVPLSQNRTAYIGERGPEGVFPLTKDSSGRLSIRGEQPQVNVDARTKIVNVFDQEEMLAAMQTEKGEKIMLNLLRRKGVI